MSKLLLLVAFWEQKTKDGPRTNKFNLKTTEDVPKKTGENAAALGITFAAKAEVTDEKLLSTTYKTAKVATDKAKAAGFEVITSQAVALQLKKKNAPATPAAPAEAATPAQAPVETSAVEPIEATPGGTVVGEGGEAAPAEGVVPAEHSVVYDAEQSAGLPVE